MMCKVRATGAALSLLLALAAAEPAKAVSEESGAVTGLPLPRFVSLRAETANARRGPSLSHRIDWTFVRRGWPLRVTAEYGQWRRVRDVDGAGGWVHQSLLSGTRTVVFAGDAMVPLHVTRSNASAVVAYAEPGAVARFKGCQEGWCQVEADAAEGWVPQTAIWGVE